jgi:transposase
MLNLEKTANSCIPVFFNENDFNKFILPHLWEGSRGPRPKLPAYKMFHYVLYVLYTGIQWKMLPVEKGENGQPEIHHTRVWYKFKQWSDRGSVVSIFRASVDALKEKGMLDLSILNGDGTNVVAKLGSDFMGYSGHKHQKGNKIVTIQDNAGNVLAPMTIATVNQSDITLLPEALRDLKTICTYSNIVLPKNTLLNLDAGFDSRKNRKLVWNAGLKPNIKENVRNRKNTKLGRKRFFDEEAYAIRYKCERTFAWEDKFRRVATQFDYKRGLAMAFHLIAFALINFRDLHT